MGGDWIVDVGFRKFFDTIDQGHLREFLKPTVRDGVILRLIGKWLNAGVLGQRGTGQSPRKARPKAEGSAPQQCCQKNAVGGLPAKGTDSPDTRCEPPARRSRPSSPKPELPPVASPSPALVTPGKSTFRELLHLADHRAAVPLLGLPGQSAAGTDPLALACCCRAAKILRLEFRFVEQPRRRR